MTAQHFTAGTTSAARRTAVMSRALDGLSNLYRAWRNRRAFYRLGEMSDAELADIGLTRSDLHVAIDVPLGMDPTVRLRTIAADRIGAIEDAARKVA